MGRDNFLSKVGLTLGCLAAIAVIFLVAFGWFQRSHSNDGAPSSSSLPSHSASGWSIRYNATKALALRGSPRIKERLPVLQEMLDEETMRQNFQARGKNGQPIPNESEAHHFIVSTLKAVAELHERNAAIDLSPLLPAIDKLAQSTDSNLKTEALKTKELLSGPAATEKKS